MNPNTSFFMCKVFSQTYGIGDSVGKCQILKNFTQLLSAYVLSIKRLERRQLIIESPPPPPPGRETGTVPLYDAYMDTILHYLYQFCQIYSRGHH